MGAKTRDDSVKARSAWDVVLPSSGLAVVGLLFFAPTGPPTERVWGGHAAVQTKPKAAPAAERPRPAPSPSTRPSVGSEIPHGFDPLEAASESDEEEATAPGAESEDTSDEEDASDQDVDADGTREMGADGTLPPVGTAPL